jgi:hypothetical protein
MSTDQRNPRIASISDHDEPVVVDNAPVRIDFGDRDVTSTPGKSFSRPFTKAVHYALVLREKGGSRERPILISHLEGDPVIMKLAREATPTTVAETLTFTVHESGGKYTVRMTATNNDFEQEGAKKGRVKPKGSDDLRLNELAIGADTVPFVKDGQFENTKVTILLVPKSEKEDEEEPLSPTS